MKQENKFYKLSEVFDSIKDLEEFLEMNKIPQEKIKEIVLVWEEEVKL